MLVLCIGDRWRVSFAYASPQASASLRVVHHTMAVRENNGWSDSTPKVGNEDE